MCQAETTNDEPSVSLTGSKTVSMFHNGVIHDDMQAFTAARSNWSDHTYEAIHKDNMGHSMERKND